jgi:hypothetical protein
MNDMRLTNAQLARSLRAVVPPTAPSGLRTRILSDVETTRQERALPGLLGRLTDVDPGARRRVALLAAAALLALGLAVAGVVGALLEERRNNPLPDLSLEPPADVAAFVRSTYEQMPELPPMTVDTLRDGTTKGRIYVDASGAIRVEEFASLDATEPSAFTIYAGTSMAQLDEVDGKLVWSQQDDAIGEDPRVFVFATMGSARSSIASGCEAAISPGEVYQESPSRGWRWVGVENVAGRPAHHFVCEDELWIDVETRMTLRSRGALLDADRQPVPGQFRTIEATRVAFGQPPAELFAMDPPDGAVAVAPDDYQCSQDPICSASPRPVVTPMPAPGSLTPPAHLDALVAESLAAFKEPPAFEAAVVHWTAKFDGGSTLVHHDGGGRYRFEQTFENSPDPPSIMLVGPDYLYQTELTTDGYRYWRDLSGRTRERPLPAYPLSMPPECPDGWTFVGVDLVHDRAADHVVCPGAIVADEYWIDRETRLVIRTQLLHDEQAGTEVQEVELSVGDQPAVLFELPPDADLR